MPFPGETMSVAQILQRKLSDAFQPTRLSIVDDSHKHAGHAGAHPDGESHFSVEIVSPLFAGKSRVERQRLVYVVLAAELRHQVHALALRTLAPGEDRG